jgi:hypothetical protein
MYVNLEMNIFTKAVEFFEKRGGCVFVTYKYVGEFI